MIKIHDGEHVPIFCEKVRSYIYIFEQKFTEIVVMYDDVGALFQGKVEYIFKVLIYNVFLSTTSSAFKLVFIDYHLESSQTRLYNF